MIICDKKFLFARAVERGYRVSEVMPCVVSQDNDQWTIDETHPAYPAVSKQPPPKGLGDMVASGLSSIGITKERVSKLAGGDCGCAKRQQALNELGRKIGIG